MSQDQNTTWKDSEGEEADYDDSLSITSDEENELKESILRVYNKIMVRAKGKPDWMINSALYSLQDFLGSVNCPIEDNGIDF